MQFTSIFHGCKNDDFQIKYCDIFLISAKNIDRGYMLEPTHEQKYGKYRLISLQNYHFMAFQNLCVMHEHVFVMLLKLYEVISYSCPIEMPAQWHEHRCSGI